MATEDVGNDECCLCGVEWRPADKAGLVVGGLQQRAVHGVTGASVSDLFSAPLRRLCRSARRSRAVPSPPSSAEASGTWRTPAQTRCGPFEPSLRNLLARRTSPSSGACDSGTRRSRPFSTCPGLTRSRVSAWEQTDESALRGGGGGGGGSGRVSTTPCS